MARIKHGHALCGRNSPTYRSWITANGKTMCLAAWALEVGIPAKALQHRLNRGWPVEKALSPLVRKRGSQEPEIVEG